MRGRETGIRHCRACHDKSGVSACVAKAGGDGSRLEIMRASKACESDEDAQAGTSRKARLRPFPVFVLFCPVIAGRLGRPDGRRARPFPVFFLVVYGDITGARLWRVPCFSPVIYRPRSPARAIPARAGTG